MRVRGARISYYDSPVGRFWFAFNRKGVFAASLRDRATFLSWLAARGVEASPRPASMPGQLEAELDAYFSGQPVEFEAPIWFAWGTDFQRAVWEVVRSIPYGQTRSYSWVAERVGRPRACRAVGAALKANPILLLVPCHRVVRADGSLGGFSPGLEVKEWLLRHEGALQGQRQRSQGRMGRR